MMLIRNWAADQSYSIKFFYKNKKMWSNFYLIFASLWWMSQGGEVTKLVQFDG